MTIDELRQAIAELDKIPEPHNAWDNRCLQLRDKILNDDPLNFLAWSVINATMFVGNAPWLVREYEALKPDWGRWMPAVRWTGFGDDAFHSGSGYTSSTNLIHQAYHLRQWEERTGQQVKDLGRIIEFGGGYGAMALLCRRLGFEGQYLILDLPEFSWLQTFYLSNTIGIDDNLLLVDDYGNAVFNTDLFIASHSLSEIGVGERVDLMSNVNAKSFLFVFHCEHDGVDNLEWFTDLAKGRPEYQWQQWVTEHLPNQVYQVGIGI